jgi:hypothetical protein
MALTEDYTFMLGDSGVILNTSSVLPFVDIEDVAGLDSAPYRETTRDHEGTDGGFMDAEFEKGRPVSLRGTVYAESDSVPSYLDGLKFNYAPSRTLVPFYFKPVGLSERVLFVKPLGARYDWNTGLRLGLVPVQFNMFAEDPRIYEAQLQSITIEQSGTSITGRSYPRSYPYDYGVAIETGQVNVPNNGNRETPALITVFGPVTTPDIFNETNGKRLKVNITLGSSETLVIDLLNHTVLLNGTANRRGLLDEPNWYLLQPGDNFIRYRATSAGPATIKFDYRHAWR